MIPCNVCIDVECTPNIKVHQKTGIFLLLINDLYLIRGGRGWGWEKRGKQFVAQLLCLGVNTVIKSYKNFIKVDLHNDNRIVSGLFSFRQLM